MERKTVDIDICDAKRSAESLLCESLALDNGGEETKPTTIWDLAFVVAGIAWVILAITVSLSLLFPDYYPWSFSSKILMIIISIFTLSLVSCIFWASIECRRIRPYSQKLLPLPKLDDSIAVASTIAVDGSARIFGFSDEIQSEFQPTSDNKKSRHPNSSNEENLNRYPRSRRATCSRVTSRMRHSRDGKLVQERKKRSAKPIDEGTHHVCLKTGDCIVDSRSCYHINHKNAILKSCKHYTRDQPISIIVYFGEENKWNIEALETGIGQKNFELLLISPGENIGTIRPILRKANICFVDADYMDEVEDTVSFCLEIRNFEPNVKIVIVSSEVRGHDLTAERAAICDATLKSPLSAYAVSEGIRAANINSQRRTRM